MTCLNSSISSEIFVSDLPSYGLIGLIIIGLILYVSYLIAYIRNSHPLSTVYIYLSQLSLLLVLISTSTFLFRPSASINYVCTIQNFSLQIFPFFLLLGYNIHLIHHWLYKTTRNVREKSCLISFSSFCIFVLVLLIELSIILIWFYHQQQQQLILHRCETECHRRLFLCSLSLNFFLLFLFSFQSSIRYHYYNQKSDLIYLFISLLALTVTITWICLYLFTRLRSSLTLYMNNNSILAYGNLFFVYSFIGPLLFEELFYTSKEHTHKTKRMTFKCLSLTKEQQRAFMAAYIKRNLTASCENLTTISMSSPRTINKQIQQPFSLTCHSTMSADSLCPTLASTVSRQILPPTIIIDTTSSELVSNENLP